MAELPQFLLKKLNSCPAAGDGVNNWLFAVSRHLHAHLDPQAIYDLLRDKTRDCGRPVPDKEIIRQIECSRAAAWRPNHPEAFAHAGELDHEIIVRPSAPAWPEFNLEAIRTIVSTGLGLADLYEPSPIRLDNGRNHCEEIIDSIFPGDPWLCCGQAKWRFATRRRETRRGQLAELPYIVPNPMVTDVGHTQEGHLSEHTLEATAARVYLVIEFDFAELSPDGTEPTPI